MISARDPRRYFFPLKSGPSPTWALPANPGMHVAFFAERVETGEGIEEPLAGHADELKQWMQRIL
jgi:hypothetical protein